MEMKCVKNYDYVRRTSTCRYEENATYDDLYGKQLISMLCVSFDLIILIFMKHNAALIAKRHIVQ